MQFFYLKNSEHNYLSVITSKKHHGKICIASETEMLDTTRLIGFSLNAHPGVLFLCTDRNDIALKLADRPFTSKIFPVGIEGGFSSHTVSIYDLLDHSWVSCPPINTVADIGKLKIKQGLNLCRLVDEKLSWEEISLEYIEAKDIVPSLKEYVICISELFEQVSGLQFVNKVLGYHCSNDLKIEILNMYYPFLGVKDLNDISFELKNSSRFRSEFLRIFEDNFWVKNALLPLFQWQENRVNRQIILCDQKYDILQKYFTQQEFSSFFHAINCVYRRNIEPSKKTCIATTVRNEGTSILEWIAWYKKLGFEHFFIFSNNNDDGSDALLQALAEANIITWIKNEMGENVRPQAKVCNYTFSILPEILDYKWCLVLDVDEFLSINRDSFVDINDLLKWIEKNEVDAIGFNWQYTCSSNMLDYRKDLVTKRIQYFINDAVIGLANNLIKSMSKPRYMISSGAHYAVWSAKYHAVYRLIQGDIHRYSHNFANYSDDPMWADHNHRGIANIIHYHYKSAKEFLLRLHRGDVLADFEDKPVTLDLFKEGTIDTFNQQHMKYGVRILDNYLFKEHELQEVIDTLLNLPNVRQAYEEVLRITDKRVNDMVDFMSRHQDILGPNARQLLHFVRN